ncbi:MAG: L(+)-tartrate dehydratase subunit alpha [Candidatus Bathyarchaeia archaeon]
MLVDFARIVAVRLPDDVLHALEGLRSLETDARSKAVYDVMFDDIRMAAERQIPICQDTGVLEFFISSGDRFPFLGALGEAVKRAVSRATAEVPLRPNAVEAFEEYNTGDNTGTLIPWMEWSIIPGVDYAEVTLYIAGGGSSLPGSSRVLFPAAGYNGVAEFVLEAVSTYGLNACPPLLVGVGIGATSEIAAMLSKRALLRPIGERNRSEKAAKFEEILKSKLDSLKIGPQGLGGRASVLGVHVEYSARHPGTLGVGVSTGCWAHRRGTIRIMSDLSCELLTHKGVSL